MARIDDDLILKIGLELGSIKDNFQDLSKEYKALNAESEKTDKLVSELTSTYVSQSKKINEVIRSNVSAIANEAKAVDAAQKAIKKSFDDTNKSVDNSKIKEFGKQIDQVFSKLEKSNIKIDSKDVDVLVKKLSSTKTDMEALTTVMGYFEDKVKSGAKNSADSIEILNLKLAETKLNIIENEKYLKELDKKIGKSAPGNTQGELLKEREASKKALEEEKIALKDYQEQVKSAAKQNATLGTELRKVKNEIVALELDGKRGSQAYNDLREKAKQLQYQIKDTNAELNRSISSTRGIDNVLGSMNALVGVFSVAQGASALFGSSSEDLQKTLVKLNGVIALLNGLQAVQNELTKTGSTLNRLYTWTQGQVAIATDATAKSTVRLAAATKLLGIGLLIGLLAVLATKWTQISKAIGFTSDESERNQSIAKKANELYGDQIAKLTLLVRQNKEVALTTEQKKKAVIDYNKDFGETLGIVKNYTELEKKLIDSAPKYIEYLKIKAKAEAAYQLSLERTKNTLEQITALSTGDLKWYEQLQDISDKAYEGLYNAFGAGLETKREISEKEISRILGLPSEEKVKKTLEGYSTVIQTSVLKMRKEQSKTDSMFNMFNSLTLEAGKLADELGIKIVSKKDLDKQKKLLEQYLKLFNDLIKKEESFRIGSLENARDREIEFLKQSLEEEKKKFEEEIKSLEISEDKKQKLREKFNLIYNSKNGSAYDKLKKDIAEIDKKYDQQIEETRLKALQAIDTTYGRISEAQINEIKQGWEKIREELRNQIKLTNNEVKKAELESLINQATEAEAKELRNFLLFNNLERLAIEKQMADSVLSIYQNNTKYIIDDENVRQATMLLLQQEYFKKRMDIIKKGMSDEDGVKLGELQSSLLGSTDPEEMTRLTNEMRKAFGDEMANEILQTVAALKEVEISLNEISQNSGLSKAMSDLGKWTKDLDSFGEQLAKSLKINGAEATEFAKSISTAINTIWGSLSAIFEAQVSEHEDRIQRLDESINELEKKVEKEKELYDKGEVNAYEIRERELENLKDQKAREQEELEKAQKNREAMQKAELVMQTIQQASNLVTASSNILEWSSAMGPYGAVVAGIAIAAMWGAFAVSKTKALEATSQTKYRTGLKKGAVSLDGPTHEQGGFSVVNSRTGKSVAEFENNEDVYVFNREQQMNYGHLMKAIIEDARGGKKIEKSLSEIYSTTTSSDGRNVVNSVNIMTNEYRETKAREVPSNKSEEILRSIYQKQQEDRENRTEYWETKEFYYVKKGGKTTKYKK